MMKIFAIDPGNTESAFVVYSCDSDKLRDKGKVLNENLLEIIDSYVSEVDCFAVEMIASYGMPVGKDVFETCLWVGRFMERIDGWLGESPALVYRKEVKMHLCQSHRAKDANIRQAIIDLFPANGGGKTPQIGTKSQPGDLYGVSADIWAALGVALTYKAKLKQLQKEAV